MASDYLISSADLEAAAQALLFGSRRDRIDWLNVCRVLNGKAGNIDGLDDVGDPCNVGKDTAFDNIAAAVSGVAA